MSRTPLTDFVAILAEPSALERFRSEPAAMATEAGLTPDLLKLILEGDSHAIRIRAIQELEGAGLSPQLSDKFDPASSPDEQPTNASSKTAVTATSDQAAPAPSYDFIRDRPITEVIDETIRYFARRTFEHAGQLVIVGSGIRAISDLTLDAEAHIRAAQKVLYCVVEPVMERRIHLLNPQAEALHALYGDDKPRWKTYLEMVNAILTPVRAGLRVCVVFYGHPGVFAWATHQVIMIARRDGFRAEMHAGVSADASLFADLGVDPAQPGCHSLEATDFLIHQRKPDVTSHLLLWQPECAGDLGFNFAGYRRHNFDILVEQLRKFYPADHPVVIYEAASLPQERPKIIRVTLRTFCQQDLTGISTLYLPPAVTPQVDQEMCQRLGITGL
jgi:precorrin-3B methylase